MKMKEKRQLLHNSGSSHRRHHRHHFDNGKLSMTGKVLAVIELAVSAIFLWLFMEHGYGSGKISGNYRYIFIVTVWNMFWSSIHKEEIMFGDRNYIEYWPESYVGNGSLLCTADGFGYGAGRWSYI